MPGCLIGSPSSLEAPDSFAWQVGTADSDYPLSNLATLDPGTVAKANETTATLRATFSAPVQLAGVVIVNTNNPGENVTLSNGSMTPLAVAVPEPEDGLSRNVWFDLRGLSGTSSAQWDLAWSGADDPPAVGAVVFVLTWEEPHIAWRYRQAERHPVYEHLTEGQRRLVLSRNVRIGSWSGQAIWTADRALVRTLRREAFGPTLPWLLIPDEDDSDALLVQFESETSEEEYVFHEDVENSPGGMTVMPLSVREVNPGIGL